ncbi:baculoviral IAP repeat-containing protein 3-like, partial [Lineus longissimus]|uniref:baculoviral IAP repeat-containing protein 3-like n=1 Tax=Lineus longissimus TaxID=88925 RepID=UPI00315C748F
SDLQPRLETYHNWPVRGLSPKELAESGFVYRGLGTRTVCFQCGIPLNEWQSHDDADIEHARFSPECTFIRQKKGKGFIKATLQMYELPIPASIEARDRSVESTATGYTRLERNEYSGNKNEQQQQQQFEPRRTPVVHLPPPPRPRAEASTPRRRPMGVAEPRQIRARLDSDWGKRLLQQGFPRELVGQVFGERLQLEGDDFPSFRELLFAVYAAADLLGITVSSGSATSIPPPAPPPENPYLQWEGNQEASSQEIPRPFQQNFDISQGLNQGANQYRPELNVPKKDPELQSAVELNKDLKRKLFCRRCSNREANILFLCCNRRVCCEECAYDVTSCLVCGSLEQERVKVFAA